MKIKKVIFENYKAFKDEQTFEVKPITILLGKNSSGKSSIAKMFTLLENSFSGRIKEPLHFINNGVELGGQFTDLVYDQQPYGPIKFSVEFDNETKIGVSVIQENDNYNLTIFEWNYRDSDFSFSIKYSPDLGYVDADGNKYECEFLGFLPTKIINANGDNLILKFKIAKAISVDYIGPFRVLPERQFYLSGQIKYKHIGTKGENAYKMLGISKKMKTDLADKVGLWYKTHFDSWELKVNDSNKPYVEIILTKGNVNVNLVDVGQGMNQILPIVVRANIMKSNSIIVIEQPELHLHPAAHGEVMELFVASAKQEGGQSYIIETHSENMLLRLRKMIVSKMYGLLPSDIVIYWVNEAGNNSQELIPITIDEDGVLSDWPDGVFNENIAEILEIKKALKNKKAAV